MSQFYKNIFNNKKVNGSASLGAADPFLIKVNGYYYLTCTRPDGLVLMKSFDLIHWENVNEDGKVGIDSTLKHAYAPEICYFDGYFYACASPSGNGHYIYRSENIEGPFERISENIHELIDGSFFVDSNEEKFFLRATETGIVLKHFNEINNNILFNNSIYFKDAIIGNWTEGPYLIKRYGKYYLTFTGTHFLSDAYRVNYVSGNNIDNEDSLKHQGILLLDTSNEFYGLGHSMNILGPNLDSYYIAYHNMMPNRNRYLNLSRLMFDNKGHMLVNGLGINNNFKIERPMFEKFINEKDYLTNEVFNDSNFSIEYNFKSNDIQLILGYKDDLNYQYITFEDNNIILNTLTNGVLSYNVLHHLAKEYNFNKYHTLRIQYKPNKLALYLDLIELNDNINVKINKGQIGFKNNDLSNAYLAYSKYSFGSSDTLNTKVDRFYLDNMTKVKDNYSTSIYIKESGNYRFDLRGKEINIENIYIDKLNVNNLSKVYLKKGIHRISFNLNKGRIEDISYYLLKEDFKELDSFNYLENMNLYGSYLKEDKGIYFENDRNALLTKFDAYSYEADCNLEIVGNPIKSENVAGLLVDVNNYSKSNPFESVYSFEGYALLENRNYVYVVEANFYHSKILKRIKINKRDINLKIIKENKKICFYLEGKAVYQIKSNYLRGKVGLYMNHASVLFKSFNLKKKEDN